jgi:hypothetical protein
MAEQPEIPADITPAQFFEQFLPMGFAAAAATASTPPGDFNIQFRLTGDGGGDWHAAIAGGEMTVRKGTGENHLRVTLSTDDWRDAVLGRTGASLAVILPHNRPGRPDNSGRAKALKGTMALELSRPDAEPFKVEMCFNDTATPRTVMRMTLAEYLGMQDGSQNGQQLFMQGRASRATWGF